MRSSRTIALLLIAALATTVLVVSVSTASGKGPNLKTLIAENINATRTCQSQLGVPRAFVPRNRSPWFPHSRAFRQKQLNKWVLHRKACLKKLNRRGHVYRAIQRGQLSLLTTNEVYAAADAEIRNGGIYGIGWGAASPRLKALCYEAVSRAFGSRAAWARYIVNRESGCNPAASNTTYSPCYDWEHCQRATGLAQLIPAIHRWVDYNRCLRDLRYSVWVFVRLSRGGTSTGPWSL